MNDCFWSPLSQEQTFSFPALIASLFDEFEADRRQSPTLRSYNRPDRFPNSGHGQHKLPLLFWAVSGPTALQRKTKRAAVGQAT